MAILETTVVPANEVVRARAVAIQGKFLPHETYINKDGEEKVRYYPVDVDSLPEALATEYEAIQVMRQELAAKTKAFEENSIWSTIYLVGVGAVSPGREVKVGLNFGKLSLYSGEARAKSAVTPKGALKFVASGTPTKTSALDNYKQAKAAR